MKLEDVKSYLESHRNEANREGMSRYGIKVDHAYGLSMVEIRSLAKTIGKDHQLAQELWDTGVHESRLLATIIDLPAKVTEGQMEEWVGEFDSWDVCDQCCSNLFSHVQ